MPSAPFHAVALAVALLFSSVAATSASAQGEDRLLDDDWQDLGDAELEGEDSAAPSDDDEEPAESDESDEKKEWADEASTGADADRALTMKLVSASTATGSLAFIGTSVGAGLALSTGALLSLMPNPPGIVTWLAFIVLPVAGGFGGAVAGSLGFMDPALMFVTGAGALAGAGVGTLIGWGIGAAFALGDPGPFGRENVHTFKTAGGLLGGMALGAAVGAATTAPFMHTKPWEEAGGAPAGDGPSAMWME